MRVFARNGCRVIVMCGTAALLGGMPQKLTAQEAQAQGTSRADIAIFDQFLDAHSDIDAQLRANPSLLTNAEYLEAHPQLENFLNQHPQIQSQLKENPSFFMERERRFDSSEARRRAGNPNPDLTRQEVATMDQFLDKYPNIDQDLRRNPGLVNNANYLQEHPQLQSFLNQHPNVKEEITENPRYFMQRENRFDAQEPGRRAGNPNPDLTRQEVATMDQFLDKYPNIDQDLRRNPGLVNNTDYLREHPQLQAFLNQHPNVKEEITENPRFFMQRENRFDAQEPGRRAGNPNPDLTRQEVATMDQFLDKYPNIDQDLRRNPGLVNNANYLQDHPQLQAFLNQHPNVKEEITENPRFFMQRENRFDAQEPGRRAGNPNPDLTRQEVATMDQFLDKYPNIDQDLRRNPGLVNNTDYLREHPQLQAFLNQHPNVKEEITENPRYFMQRENRFDAQEPPRRDNDRDADRDRDNGANARNDNRNGDRNFDRNRDTDRDRDARDDDRDFDRNRSQDRDADRNRDEDRDRDARRDRDFDGRTNPNPDLTNREVATMDDFLDRHQDIAKSLEKKPDLINDRKYLERHKDLDEFLREHPAVREEVRENPTYFMHRENQFEARNMDRDVPDRDRDRDRSRDRAGDRDRNVRDADADLDKKELRDMDHFLDKHKNIDKDLQRNPSLVNDRDYLKHHKSLSNFLSKNPRVGEEVRENPSQFMRNEERLEARNHRMNDHQPTAKPKTKVEQKEQMNTATPH
jgi:hypothetical protein